MCVTKIMLILSCVSHSISNHGIHPPPPPQKKNIWGDLSINFAYIIWGLRCDVNFWGELLFWGELHSLYGLEVYRKINIDLNFISIYHFPHCCMLVKTKSDFEIKLSSTVSLAHNAYFCKT